MRRTTANPGKLETTGNLSIRGRAEVAVILDTACDSDQKLLHRGCFQVNVGSNVGSRCIRFINRPEAGEHLGERRRRFACIRAVENGRRSDREGGIIAMLEFVAIASRFHAKSNVQRTHGRMPEQTSDVCVGHELVQLQRASVERCRLVARGMVRRVSTPNRGVAPYST